MLDGWDSERAVRACEQHGASHIFCELLEGSGLSSSRSSKTVIEVETQRLTYTTDFSKPSKTFVEMGQKGLTVQLHNQQDQKVAR